MGIELGSTLHCSSLNFVNQRVLKQGCIGVLVSSVCLLLSPSLLLKIALIAVSAFCLLACAWSRKRTGDGAVMRVAATGTSAVSGGVAKGDLEYIMHVMYDTEYKVLKKNCALYYGGFPQIPSYIEFDDKSNKVNLYVRMEGLSKEPKKKIIPYVCEFPGAAVRFFGVLCYPEDPMREVSVEEVEEKLSRDVETDGIEIEYPRSVAEEHFDQEFIESITEAFISFFTTERAEIELEILSKEGDLAIRFRGRVISVKAYLASLDSSEKPLLNIRPEMIEPYMKKHAFQEPIFSDAPECDTLAKLLGAGALRMYTSGYYIRMNNLMRGVKIDKITDKEILEAIFHIILLNHRLHTFSKIDFRAAKLRKDARIPLPILNDLIMAYKKDRVVHNSAFFSTTRLTHCVMQGDRNVTFNVTPLPYSASQGILVYKRGSVSKNEGVDGGEEEVLFIPRTVFKIAAIFKNTYKFRNVKGEICCEKIHYTIDLQELTSIKSADKGLGIV